ncbi:MAG TPA: sodium:proton antiporter [Planctomycetota bacterium]|nr:sodium:proton antiporter [Planctomycetota bacterium]
MPEHLHLLTLLLATAVSCQWIANRLQIPAIILLLAAGITLGPGLGVLVPEQLFGHLLTPFVSLSVAVILFEGGLSLNLREARVAGRPLWRLLLSGLVVGFTVVTAAGVLLAGLTLGTASVLGAILVVTGPTVIVPMLRTAHIARRPATLLRWEGIVNDPLGALLAILVFQLAAQTATGNGAMSIAGHFLVGAVASAGLGVVVGVSLDTALDKGWIAEHLKSPVMLGAVIGVYTVAEMLGHETGLLAVTAMGLLLANRENPHVEDIRHFKEHLSTLLIGFLFVTLSASLHVADLQRLAGPPALLVAFILLVARPLVAFCAGIGSGLPWQERALLAWIAPRGVVAAAVAGAFEPRLREAGYADADLLVPIVFGVIVATVVLHGLTLRPLARALGLGAGGGAGMLIVGGARWTVQLALTLRKAGAEVVMIDSTYRRVSRARREGLEVYYGDVLSEEMEFELPMERLSFVLAANDDDAYNSLVCMRLAGTLGRNNVLQLAVSPDDRGRKEAGHRLMGRVPWGERSTFQEITARYWSAGAFKVTTLSAEFPWPKLQQQHPDGLFLFWVRQDKLGVVEADKAPPDGAKVVLMTGGVAGAQPTAADAG